MIEGGLEGSAHAVKAAMMCRRMNTSHQSVSDACGECKVESLGLCFLNSLDDQRQRLTDRIS